MKSESVYKSVIASVNTIHCSNKVWPMLSWQQCHYNSNKVSATASHQHECQNNEFDWCGAINKSCLNRICFRAKWQLSQIKQFLATWQECLSRTFPVPDLFFLFFFVKYWSLVKKDNYTIYKIHIFYNIHSSKQETYSDNALPPCPLEIALDRRDKTVQAPCFLPSQSLKGHEAQRVTGSEREVYIRGLSTAFPARSSAATADYEKAGQWSFSRTSNISESSLFADFRDWL